MNRIAAASAVLGAVLAVAGCASVPMAAEKGTR
jgi:hypothetical protein